MYGLSVDGHPFVCMLSVAGTVAELSNYYRDHMAHKVKEINYWGWRVTQ